MLDPARSLISATEVGADVRDAVAVESLGLGIEGCFRAGVANAYAGWPSGYTTDGRTVGICTRSGDATLDVAGLMWLDFTAHVFPFRAVVTVADNAGSLAAYIGAVDPATGAPPRLSAGTVILPIRSEDGALVGVQMIVGRRQVPIDWTKVFDRSLG